MREREVQLSFPEDGRYTQDTEALIIWMLLLASPSQSTLDSRLAAADKPSLPAGEGARVEPDEPHQRSERFPGLAPGSTPLPQGTITGLLRQRGRRAVVHHLGLIISGPPTEKFAVQHAQAHPGAEQRHLAQLELERKLLARCRPFLDDPLAVQGKLCRCIERFIKELFVFVAEPDVPSENNAAERSLRHLVTTRKISGGTRSDQSLPP